MFTVVIAEKEGAERRVTFSEAEVTIGRVPGNDVVLPKGNVSKRHSRIVLKDNRFIVVDLKSTNGTYVNGRKITSPLVVKEGDKIYVGDYVLTLEGATALDGLKPPSPGTSSMQQDQASRLSPNGTAGQHEIDDDELPAVLRGTVVQSSIPAPHSGAPSGEQANDGENAAEVGAEAAADDEQESVLDDEHILPAESELEVFEEPSSHEQARALLGSLSVDDERESDQVFPPPMGDDHGREPSAGLLIMPDLVHDAESVLGPLEALLADEQVFHVVVERFDRIRADRGDGLKLEDATFGSPQALVGVAEEVLAQSGLPLGTPSYDISLSNGLQVVALLPAAASNGAVLSIRRRPSRIDSLAALSELRVVTSAVSAKLQQALEHRRHVWLVAPSGLDVSGFFASVLALYPEHERLALFERAPEVAIGERSTLCIKLGSVPVTELLERVRSFRPDRLAVYDLREEELSAVLSAFAHRAEGNLASFEARSAKDALAAFSRAVGADLALRAASLLVELKRGEDGKAKVSGAYEVELAASGDLTLKQV